MIRVVMCMLASACILRVFALEVTIDRPSPAAEKDFAYHLWKMGATETVTLKVAEHPHGVVCAADEAFRLKIDGGKAWVSGRSAAAVSHGLYELLERMGCRWVMPGKIGEVIPACADPKPADCDVEESPSFAVRCPWYTGSQRDRIASEWADYDLWKLRHKLQLEREHHPYLMRGGHTWQDIIRLNKVEFDAHPEMYALVRQVDGSFKRQGPQLETTHPRVIELFEKYIRDQFAANGWAKDEKVCLSVGPADGVGFSESAESRAIASGRIDPMTGWTDQTDTMVELCNRLLKRIGKEFPNLRLGFYLYSCHADFPMRYKPDPRIVIVIADITYSRMHSTLEPIPGRIYYKDVLDCWAKLPNLKFFRGYNWNLAESFLPYSKLKMWADDLPMYHAMNVQGVYNEEEVAWATLAPGNYLEAKLLWNVKADLAAVLDDFCRAAYGKGAVPMADYYRRLTERQSAAKVETGSFHGFHLIYDAAFVAASGKLFDAALAAAESEAEKERVRVARFPLDQLGVFLELRRKQFAFDFTGALKLYEDSIAARMAMRERKEGQVSAAAMRMLNRFFERPLRESVKYTTAPYRMICALPDEMTTGLDPWNRGAAMGFARADIDDAGWLKTKTYSTPWSVQGLMPYALGSVWYRVRIPAIREENVGLLIGGADSVVRVYANGTYVGMGQGFAKPFAFDLTGLVHADRENFLAIQVEHPSNSELGTGGIVYPSFLFAGPRLASRAPKCDKVERLLPGGAVE